MIFLILFFIFLALGFYVLLRYNPPASDDSIANARRVKSRASTDANWLGATAERKNVEARTKLNTAVAAEMRTHGELVTAEADVHIANNDFLYKIAVGRLESEQRLLEAQTKTMFAKSLAEASEQLSLAVVNGELTIVARAARAGLDKPTYLEIAKAALMDENRLRTRWTEKKQDLNAMVEYAQQQYMILYFFVEMIKEMYRKAESESERERALTEEHITFMEESYRFRKKVLQTEVDTSPLGEEESEVNSGE